MGGPEKHEKLSDSPIIQLMVSMSGAGAPEHESEPPGASPTSLKAGHEPDMFPLTGILYVPIFVVIVLVGTYLIVSGTFFKVLEVDQKTPRPGAFEQTVKENKAPISERLNRISSTEPESQVHEPRLDGLVRPGEESADDPAYLRSKRPLDTGVYLDIRPEDLRSANYIDPSLRRKVLDENEWVVPNQTARIKIDEAIKLTVKSLPIRKDPVQLDRGDNKAKLSNAGRGGRTFALSQEAEKAAPTTPTPVVPTPPKK